MNAIRGKINIDVANRVLTEHLHNLAMEEVVFSYEQIDLRKIKILDAPKPLKIDLKHLESAKTMILDA